VARAAFGEIDAHATGGSVMKQIFLLARYFIPFLMSFTRARSLYSFAEVSNDIGFIAFSGNPVL